MSKKCTLEIFDDKGKKIFNYVDVDESELNALVEKIKKEHSAEKIKSMKMKIILGKEQN